MIAINVPKTVAIKTVKVANPKVPIRPLINTSLYLVHISMIC